MSEIVHLGDKATIEWRVDEYTEAVRKEYVKRVARATELVKNQVVRNITEHQTRTEGPSKPGEYPHADTGLLAKSIFSKVIDTSLYGIVGTALQYGLYLEYDTIHIKDRTFLRRTLYELRDPVAKIFAEPLPSGLLPSGQLRIAGLAA